MKKIFHILFVAFMISLFSSFLGCSKEKSLREQYPGPWRDDFDWKITSTLAKNHIRNCGEYKFRANIDSSGEYLVRCTADGKNWQDYLVWTNINEVMGPYAPDPSL